MARKQEKGEKHWRKRLAVVLNEAREKLSSEGVARCLLRRLSKEELAELTKSEATTAEQAKSKFADAILERSQGSETLKVAVASAAKDAVGGWKRSRKLLNNVPGIRLWSRVNQKKPQQGRGRKSTVHSRYVREKVRAYLLESASSTGKLINVEGSVLPVYNLDTSKHKLWLRSQTMQRLLSKTSWFLHLSKLTPETVPASEDTN